jgi:DNA-binding transcriptional ArsR family regulator
MKSSNGFLLIKQKSKPLHFSSGSGIISMDIEISNEGESMMRSTGLSPDGVTVALRALADPTRLRVYRLLREGESCVCEMATSLSLAENLISHHLGVLRKAALVRARTDDQDARWVYYSLDRDTLRILQREIGDLFDPETIGERQPTCGPASRLLQPLRPSAQS